MQSAHTATFVKRTGDFVEKARQIRPGIGEVGAATVACPAEAARVRART